MCEGKAGSVTLISFWAQSKNSERALQTSLNHNLVINLMTMKNVQNSNF